MKFKSKFLFLKECLIQIKSNKSRLFLTSSGVILATMLFMIAEIVVNTYVESLYMEARKCSQKGVLVTGTLSEKLVADAYVHFDDYHISEFITPLLSSTLSYNWENMELTIMPTIIGTSAELFSGPVCATQGELTIYDSEIIEGRTIESDDIHNKNRVVVISELAEDVFFNGNSAIGQTIELSVTGKASDVESFRVIGVYANSYDENYVINQISTAKKKEINAVNVQLNCYIPYTVVTDNVESSADIQALVIAVGTDEIKKNNVRSYYSMTDTVNVCDYETKISDIDELNTDIMIFVHALVIVVFLIAGLNLFNSMMFSVKERIGEIGIRKAIGASGFDIVRQFVFECIVISLFGTAVAAVIVIIGAAIVQIIINMYSVLSIKIILTSKIIIEIFCYVLLIGVLFGILPALIAAKTNIIDAIRFD